jgi:hypothetical protein
VLAETLVFLPLFLQVAVVVALLTLPQILHNLEPMGDQVVERRLNQMVQMVVEVEFQAKEMLVVVTVVIPLHRMVLAAAAVLERRH